MCSGPKIKKKQKKGGVFGGFWWPRTLRAESVGPTQTNSPQQPAISQGALIAHSFWEFLKHSQSPNTMPYKLLVQTKKIGNILNVFQYSEFHYNDIVL